MSQTPRDHEENSTVQQYFAYLDRCDKVADRFLAIFGVAIFLLMVIGGIVLLL